MRTIYKYPLSITDVTEIRIPESAKVVHVGLDPGSEPCIWFELETLEPDVKRFFEIIGTGHEVDPDTKHVGSFIQGPYVWHVFEQN